MGKVRSNAMAKRNIGQSLTEALFGLYLYGKKAPYRVPSRLDGDLFLFVTARTWNEAKSTIKAAVDHSLSHITD